MSLSLAPASAAATLLGCSSFLYGFPHGGESRSLSALRYSLARKSGSSPMSMWLHGSRAVTGSVPSGRAVSNPVRGDVSATACSHRSIRSASSQLSKRQPRRKAASRRSPARRSPRAKIPSMWDCWFSCILRFTRSARARSARSACLRVVSASVSIDAH